MITDNLPPESLPVPDVGYIEFDNEEQRKEIGNMWNERFEQFKKVNDQWLKDAEEAEGVYYNEIKSDDAQKEMGTNIFYANVQHIIPMAVQSNPSPTIEHLATNDDETDKIMKAVADIRQSVLEQEIDNGRFARAIKDATKESVIYGVGRVRVLFSRKEKQLGFGNYASEDTLQFKSIHYKNFMHGYAEDWETVPWIAFKHEVTKDEIELLYDEQMSEGMALPSNKDMQESTYIDQNKDVYVVYEVWDGINKEVLFIREEDMLVISRQSDPHNLNNFYPVSHPIYMDKHMGSLVPKTCYSSIKYLHRLLQAITAMEYEMATGMVPRYVTDLNSTVFQEWAGGKERQVHFDPELLKSIINMKAGMSPSLQDHLIPWPYKDDADVLTILGNVKRAVIEQIQYVTGIGDIMHSKTDAREAAITQKMKSQAGVIRLMELQDSVSYAVVDVFQIASEFIANSYTIESIERKSGRFLQEGDPLDQAIMQVLSNPDLADFRIDVESESMKMVDDEQIAQKIGAVSIIEKGIFEQLIAVPQDMPQVKLALLIAAQAKIDLLRLPRGVRRGYDEALNAMRRDVEREIEIMSDPEQRQMREQEDLEKEKQRNPEWAKVQATVMKEQNAAQAEQFKAQREQQGIELDREKAEADTRERIERMAFDRQKHTDEMANKQKELDQTAYFNNEQLKNDRIKTDNDKAFKDKQNELQEFHYETERIGTMSEKKVEEASIRDGNPRKSEIAE